MPGGVRHDAGAADSASTSSRGSSRTTPRCGRCARRRRDPRRNEWPRLHDPDVLRSNDDPAAAAIYANDLYVERRFSEETAASIRGLRPWVTSEYEHNGVRADGARVSGT